MNRSIRGRVAGAMLAAILIGSAGCQTYQVGQVLPSPWHLRDDLHYAPKGPRFPLAQELNQMQASEAERQAAGVNP